MCNTYTRNERKSSDILFKMARDFHTWRKQYPLVVHYDEFLCRYQCPSVHHIIATQYMALYKNTHKLVKLL